LIQPWLGEKSRVNSPDVGDAEASIGHLSYNFDKATEAQVIIRVQE